MPKLNIDTEEVIERLARLRETVANRKADLKDCEEKVTKLTGKIQTLNEQVQDLNLKIKWLSVVLDELNRTGKPIGN